MGSSEADLAFIEMLQPIVSGSGTVIKGVGAIFTVIGALAALGRPALPAPPPAKAVSPMRGRGLWFTTSATMPSSRTSLEARQPIASADGAPAKDRMEISEVRTKRVLT